MGEKQQECGRLWVVLACFIAGAATSAATSGLHRILTASPDESPARVILYHDGQAQVSSVGRIGPYCWVEWYSGIQKVLLYSNGTAHDGPLFYSWTRDIPGPKDAYADHVWFTSSCTDPPPEEK